MKNQKSTTKEKKNQEIKEEDKFTQIYLATNCFGDPNKVYIGKERIGVKNSRKGSHIQTFGNNITFDYIDKVEGIFYEDWGPLECFWIEQFRQWGFELMNKNKGGSGPSTITNETKLKIGLANSKPKPESFRIWSKTRKHSELEILKMTKTRNSDEYKLKMKLVILKRQELGIKTTRKGKSILQYDLEGNFIREWKSGVEVIKNLNIRIFGCCSGKGKTAGGFIWKYK